jgi:hypothetical protein
MSSYKPDDGDWRLPQAGFVRLPMILAPKGPIPVGKSTWWAGVKSGCESASNFDPRRYRRKSLSGRRFLGNRWGHDSTPIKSSENPQFCR